MYTRWNKGIKGYGGGNTENEETNQACGVFTKYIFSIHAHLLNHDRLHHAKE